LPLDAVLAVGRAVEDARRAQRKHARPIHTAPLVERGGQFHLPDDRTAVDVQLKAALAEKLWQAARVAERVEVVGDGRARAEFLLKVAAPFEDTADQRFATRQVDIRL